MRINAVLVSLQSAKPGYAYGQINHTPLDAGAKLALLRAVLPADIPATAIVTKAELVFHAAAATTGSRAIGVQRSATGWQVSTVKFNNAPAGTGTIGSATVGAVAYNAQFRIDVAAHVQMFVSGSAVNRGWVVATDDTNPWYVKGSNAATGQPWLDFEYVLPSDAPTDLSPDGGAVSVAKPTLTWSGSEDRVSFQVQIDAAADELSPDFDSGEVAGVAGVLDLTTTAYAGLADGAETSWRVRDKTDVGWTSWSEWSTFPRAVKTTVTITSPGATTGDRTPPIAWTAPDQVSWRVQLRGITGNLLADSGIVTSADLEWTPPKGLTKIGQQGVATVTVWDDVDRVATPGDPVYAVDSQTFTLVTAGAAPGADAISVTAVGMSPSLRVAWEGTSDQWVVTRDGRWLDIIDGANKVYLDHLATPRTNHVYKVLMRTDEGVVSPNGPTDTKAAYPLGVWLVDLDDDQAIFVMDESVVVNMPDQASLHNVLDGPPVRRRIGKPPPNGSVAGTLIDTPYTVDDYPAAALAATAMRMAVADQNRVYRLVWGDWNIPVTIGDVNVSPIDPGDNQVGFSISFSWWQDDSELPWDED